MNISEILYLGVKGHVVATDKRDGRLLWQTKLKGGFLSSSADFVTVLVDGDRIYAHTAGELFCLDAISGQQLWQNGLDGLGYGIACLAIEGSAVPSAAVIARIQQKRNEENSSSSNSSGS